MGNPQQQRQRLNRRRTERALESMTLALKALEEEYSNPQRQKLTHSWLAWKLDIPSHVAYKLLQMCVRHSIYIVQIGTGPIYWTDAKISVGEVMDILRRQTLGDFSIHRK